MGVSTSREHDILDTTDWIRTVVQRYQKSAGGSVNSFQAFTIEPVVDVETGEGDVGSVDNRSGDSGEPTNRPAAVAHAIDVATGIQRRRVAVVFRDEKDITQEVLLNNLDVGTLLVNLILVFLSPARYTGSSSPPPSVSAVQKACRIWATRSSSTCRCFQRCDAF